MTMPKINPETGIRKVEEALIQSYRTPIPVEPDPFFHTKVMAKILEENQSIQNTVSNQYAMGKVVWRFAFAGYLLVIMLFIQLITSDIDSQYLLSSFFLGDSSSVDIVHTFGMQ
jgi:hypothetical protein